MIKRKAILYVRVSTDEQANGYSLSYQEERLRNYCELQNIEIVGVYREDHTAKHFNRPELQKILLYLKKNKGTVDILLFLRWDRFSRNAGDAYGMINFLHKSQVTPQAIEQPLDLSVPENKMMLAFYLASPEVENDRRALNTLTGMRKARKAGRFLGKAPQGYLNGKDDLGKPLLVPDPKLAPVVKWMFEELAAGVQDIETIGRLARRRGLTVGKSQLWNLVHNEVYCGRVFISAYKDEPAHTVKGIHQPIISEALFSEVQDILSGRKIKKKAPSTLNEELPLRGFLVCQICGKPLTGSASSGNGGRFYYYHCQTASQCKSRFRATVAHDAFLQLLKQITTKKEVLDLYRAILIDVFEKDGVEKGQQTKMLQNESTKLMQRLQNAQILMLDGELSVEEYRNIKNTLQPEIERLEQKKLNLLSSKEDYRSYVTKGIPLLQNIAKVYTAADLVEKQQLIGSIFAEKMVFRKIDIEQ